MRVQQWQGEAQRKTNFSPVNETIHCDIVVSLQHDATTCLPAGYCSKPEAEEDENHCCGPDCLSLVQLSLCCEKLSSLPISPTQNQSVIFCQSQSSYFTFHFVNVIWPRKNIINLQLLLLSDLLAVSHCSIPTQITVKQHFPKKYRIVWWETQ